MHAKREGDIPVPTAKRIAVLRDLIETRQRLAAAPRWLIRVEWWAERALLWGNSWFRRWALLRLAIAISVIVPVGWTIWTYTETLRDREQADRITALTLINSTVPKDHPTVRQALAFLLSRNISLRNVQWSFADLTGANLSGADLVRANLHNANFSGADLSGAKISDAGLSFAILTKANLRGAQLRGTELGGAELTNADFEDVTGAPDLSDSCADPDNPPINLPDDVTLPEVWEPCQSEEGHSGFPLPGLGASVVHESPSRNEPGRR